MIIGWKLVPVMVFCYQAMMLPGREIAGFFAPAGLNAGGGRNIPGFARRKNRVIGAHQVLNWACPKV
jgi:hypothetical protein